MIKNRFLIVFVIILSLLILQVGAAYAAPLQDTLPDGTIVSVTQSTDASNNTIFVVVVTDSNGVNQTVNLTPTEAEQAGLVTDNGDGTFTINAVAGDTIVGGQLKPNPCTSTETEPNPVAAAMTAFFCAIGGGTNVLDTSIGELHTEGFGFGEIAQACFMAEALNTTCSSLLEDKKNHDFSGLGLTDVQNWGQLRKHVVEQVLQDKLHNLGFIMSGQGSEEGVTPTPLAPMSPFVIPGNGHGHGNGNGGGNGNGHGHKP